MNTISEKIANSNHEVDHNAHDIGERSNAKHNSRHWFFPDSTLYVVEPFNKCKHDNEQTAVDSSLLPSIFHIEPSGFQAKNEQQLLPATTTPSISFESFPMHTLAIPIPIVS